jgi:hypothetical protein
VDAEELRVSLCAQVLRSHAGIGQALAETVGVDAALVVFTNSEAGSVRSERKNLHLCLFCGDHLGPIVMCAASWVKGTHAAEGGFAT